MAQGQGQIQEQKLEQRLGQTISQQQLLFTLEDTRLSCRYLWLAERIGGSRIILYATHAPTGAAVSSEAYQEFRERTTHTNQTTEL